ncbi:MAG: VOC family protein [Nitrospinota bacterium]
MFETTQACVDVGIVVKDIEKSLAFYQGVLGMKEVTVVDLPADFARAAGFATDGFKLHFLKFGDMMVKLLEFAEPPAPRDPAANAQTGFRYLTFWVKNMDDAVTYLKSKGVTFKAEPIERAPGRKVVFFGDPDGNLLELLGP